jgi:hypothetical protein
MRIALLADLLSRARHWRNLATSAADDMGLEKFATFNEALEYSKKNMDAQMLSHEPGYTDIEQFEGVRAWGALLAFDLRKSTERALRIGARDTYITMHTYIPTMLKLIGAVDGRIVGLRGDGAIACFGLVDLGVKAKTVTSEEAASAVGRACDCGDAMVKAVQKAVNPVLREGGVEGNLRIGVGIDVGEIVATNIGLGKANELTAYGNCVNKACKRSFGNDMVVLTREAKRMFPTAVGGRTRFPAYPDKEDAYILRYPEDYSTVA